MVRLALRKFIGSGEHRETYLWSVFYLSGQVQHVSDCSFLLLCFMPAATGNGGFHLAKGFADTIETIDAIRKDSFFFG